MMKPATTLMPFETWITLHLPQLTHYNVPVPLYRDIHNCVHGIEGKWTDFEAVSRTRTSSDLSRRTRGSRRKLRVVATTSLLKASKVLRVIHEWEFQSVLDAQMQLRQDGALRHRMKMVIGKVIEEVKEGDEAMRTRSKLNEVEEEVLEVVQCLHFLAYSVRFGARSRDMLYYVLNAVGSSLREDNKESNLMVVPIFCIEQQKLFSIAWTSKDVVAGMELVRPCANKISMMGLCKKSYWEARFETEDEFDWYCEYAHIREVLAPYLSKTARILIAGTGTSRLPAEMALDGFSDVVAMDYAANVIMKMQTRSRENAWGVRFVEADLTQMKDWGSNCVDCVIDKGCLDAMLLKPETDGGETSWKQVALDSPDDLIDARNSMQQLARILKPDGLLVLLTFGSPGNRVGLFNWVASDRSDHMEWEILQCLEMTPSTNQPTFVTRFFLFVARKKHK